jgi:protein-arginine kinase activator protein McsA
MIPVEFCNLCQSKPAQGIMTGYWYGEEELSEIMACNECAEKTPRLDHP